MERINRSKNKPKSNTENVADAVRMVEALLFASAIPLTERQILSNIPYDIDVKAALKILSGEYSERGVQLVQSGGSWAFRTAPDLAEVFTRDVAVSKKLSNAAIETLSIIAYHQPITRTEMEEIRGVGVSKGTIDVLLSHGWIRPRGRRKSPGRPLMWGTNDTFLDHFGLRKIEDLPGLSELKSMGLLDSTEKLVDQSLNNFSRKEIPISNANIENELLPDSIESMSDENS